MWHFFTCISSLTETLLVLFIYLFILFITKTGKTLLDLKSELISLKYLILFLPLVFCIQQVKATLLVRHEKSSLWKNRWSWRGGWWTSAVSWTRGRSRQRPNVSLPLCFKGTLDVAVHVCNVFCKSYVGSAPHHSDLFLQLINLRRRPTPRRLVSAPPAPPQTLHHRPLRLHPQTQATRTRAESELLRLFLYEWVTWRTRYVPPEYWTVVGGQKRPAELVQRDGALLRSACPCSPGCEGRWL